MRDFPEIARRAGIDAVRITPLEPHTPSPSIIEVVLPGGATLLVDLDETQRAIALRAYDRHGLWARVPL